jgi:MYXO-CTERM domain-containing protein
MDVLQGGGTWLTDDLWEQWYNCEDAFCYAWADPSDATAWTVDSEPVLTKNWATWNSGYIQAPTPWLVDGTFHMWFNGYDYGTGFESLGHARTVPEPGEWAVLALSWDGATLSVSMDGGQVLEAAATGVEGLGLLSTGTVEIQTLSYTATESADDTGVDTGTDTSEDTAVETGDDTGSTGGGDTVDTSSDTGDGGAVEPDTDGGCGCGVGTGTSANFATLLVLGGLMVRRRRRSNGDI